MSSRLRQSQHSKPIDMLRRRWTAIGQKLDANPVLPASTVSDSDFVTIIRRRALDVRHNTIC